MTKSTTPKTPEFNEVQKKILRAFIDLCYEDGVPNVTLQKVAARSKVAFGTVRYHFAGEKMDLLHSGVFYVVKDGQDYITNYLAKAAAAPKYNGVHEYIRGTFQWYRDEPKLGSYMFNFYYQCTTETELSLDNKTFLETARVRVRSQIFEAVGRGLYSKPKDPDQLAQQIHALLVGCILMAASERNPTRFNHFLKVTLLAVDALLNGGL